MKKKKIPWLYPLVMTLIIASILFFFYWYSDYRIQKIEIPHENEIQMTTEQKYLDFDFITEKYQEISANYLIDKEKIDINYATKSSRNNIGQTKDIIAYIIALRNFRFQNFSYNSLVSSYNFIDGIQIYPDKEPEKTIGKYIHDIDESGAVNKPTDYFLAKDREVVDKNINYTKFFKELGIENGIEMSPNIRKPRELMLSQIEGLNKKNIQYIRVRSFNNSDKLITGDLNTLTSYKDVISNLNNKDGLIIDLRSSFNGDSSYFRENFLKYIIPNDLKIEEYVGRRDFNNSKFEETFLKLTTEDRKILAEKGLIKNYFKDISVEKIDSLPKEMTNVNPKDLSYLKNLYKITDNLNAKSDGYKGKILVLVDSQTFGESEHVAKILSTLENVTVIGQKTCGEGVASTIGLEKIVLPNSKLLFRMQTLYGFNDDGSNNYDSGFSPDKNVDFGVTLDLAFEEFGIK